MIPSLIKIGHVCPGYFARISPCERRWPNKPIVPSLVKINPCSGSNAEEFVHVCIFNIPQLSPLGVGCGHSCEEKNLEIPFSKIV